MGLSLRAEYLVETLNLPEAAQFENAKWERFQLEHLSDNSKLRNEVKSRQIAWSFTAAAEAVADAHLNAQSSIFVSINLEESAEKIRYAKRVHENIELYGKPKLKRANQLALEFDNGARVMSVFQVRGKAGMNVYFDEFAHKRDDRALYTASLPILSKGGRLRMGSSPMGQSGMFWDVYTQTLRAYPGFTRKRTPWWEVEAFCRDVHKAKKLCDTLRSEQMVERFGTEAIQTIFENILLEDFKQEYEAIFVDEATAWISWEEIARAQDEQLECPRISVEGNNVQRVLKALKTFKVLESSYGVGVDIGRTRNATEIYIGARGANGVLALALTLTLTNTEFDVQRDVLESVLASLPVSKMLIDKNGLGMQLAEQLEKKYKGKVEGALFTNQSKALWAVNAKLEFQRGHILLPVDREMSYQIHSIKKKLTAAKNSVFDTDGSEKHHADKFWALALMIEACAHKVFRRKAAQSAAAFKAMKGKLKRDRNS